MSTEIIPQGKHIAFDHETGDYAAYYNGELLGYERTYEAAQTLADQHVYELFRRGAPITAGVKTQDVASLVAGAE